MAIPCSYHAPLLLLTQMVRVGAATQAAEFQNRTTWLVAAVTAMSNELFTMTYGVKTDAELHDDILDNQDADQKLSRAAIERAVARGMSRAEARKVYGIKGGKE